MSDIQRNKSRRAFDKDERQPCLFLLFKKGGNESQGNTCSRRRQCTEKMNADDQRKFYHHPLLHNPNQTNSVGVASIVNSRGTLLLWGKGRKLYRGSGSVDLLVGIDHAKLHTGETKEAENLVVRHSPLGWVVFGAIGGNQSGANRVLHVKLSNPVDLTDFWTTEAMGVTAKPCECQPARQINQVEREGAKVIEDSCKKVGNQWLIPYPWTRDPKLLPNNEHQALKKLEATERRLKKNQVEAEARTSRSRSELRKF